MAAPVVPGCDGSLILGSPNIAAVGHSEGAKYGARNESVKWLSRELFRGTLTEARVYPREVVRRALHYNAAAVILAHNHPSGSAAPSQDDRRLTRDLVRALRLVDIDVFDHFIVAGTDVYSFVEHGLL